jgi:hypothetical protein
MDMALNSTSSASFDPLARFQLRAFSHMNNKYMKNSRLFVGLLVAGIALLANSALASGGTLPVPDGGSSALLLVISLAGLTFVRKHLR